MWNYWEQIRYVAHSLMIVGVTTALLNLLGTYIVHSQSVRVYFALTKNFSVSWRSDFRCLQWGFTCKLRNIPVKEQTVSYLLKCHQGIYIFQEMLLDTCIVQNALKKSVFTFQPTKILVSTPVKSAKLALTCLIFFLRNKIRQYPYLVEMIHVFL